ncbi:MAG TPA: hypothetical protein VN784_12840 [Candidatus Limnocylindrales bacterium]|nr:hypothetical protein [Candidatus Limnocylindrales bacterium]
MNFAAGKFPLFPNFGRTLASWLTSRLEYDIADANKRAKELETKVGAHFEREERYQELTRRQSEIEEKLDLTKNQAPSQVDADAPDEAAQKNSEKQTQAHSPRPRHRADIRV